MNCVQVAKTVCLMVFICTICNIWTVDKYSLEIFTLDKDVARITSDSSLVIHTPAIKIDAKIDPVNSNKSKHNAVVCGRKIPGSYLNDAPHSHNSILPVSAPARNLDHFIVIGHDTFGGGQTNNHINAILHAIDYAHDQNANLALVENGWAVKVLKLLFRDTANVDDEKWVRNIEKYMNLRIISSGDLDVMTKGSHKSFSYVSSYDMYYYHTEKADLFTILERRLPAMRYLWMHPTMKRKSKDSESHNGDMCSAVSSLSLPSEYVVIHSRWMKSEKNGCLGRSKKLVKRIHKETGIRVDHHAPCLLEPSYIASILRRNHLLRKNVPIYVISDGKNHNITKALSKHPIFGKNVKTVPDHLSWVGSDMMLGVLSSIFIGTPISTMSGNIARARVALGFDPKTNYLFPKEQNNTVERPADSRRRKEKNEWNFACRTTRCLYDTRYLYHYVG